MARGRFISNTISTSRKFERLVSNDHRLMYLMLVPHVDCEGRHAADARILGGQVYTLLDLTRKQIDAALRDLHDVGLIRLYEVDGEPFLELADFHEHNKVRRGPDGQPTHEAPSRIPPSSDGNEIAPATEPQRSSDVAATAEVEVEVEVQDQDKGKGKGTTLSSPQATRDKYQPFMDAWNWHRGALPEWDTLGDKRRAGINRLIKEFGDGALNRFADAVQYVASETYWQQQGYNIDNLLVRGRVLEKSDKHKANRGMSAGDRKLATTASVIARAIGGMDA